MDRILSYLNNRRLLVILLLGFSSGLPLALTSTTLQAWFTVSGVSILTIGLLGLVGQPYIYKFIWAPIMDRYELPWFGKRRGWMLLTQVLLLITICSMSFLQPILHPLLLASIGLLVAFLSASQDITIDAYRTDLLSEPERGMGAAMAIAGYRIAMLMSGGIALVLAQMIGWQITYVLMGLCMTIGILASLAAPEPEFEMRAPESLLKAIVLPCQDLLNRKGSLVILGFIIIYKLSYEFILSMTPTFLLRDLGFSLVQVGTITRGIGLIALLIGLLIGGVVLIRITVIRALLIFGGLQALSILGYIYLSLIGKSLYTLIFVVCAENLFVGMESTAFIAFLMGLCHHRYTAMQFALLSALATFGRIIAGPIGAVVVDYSSWTYFYTLSFLIALPSLVLLWYQQNSFSLTFQPVLGDCRGDSQGDSDCQTHKRYVESKIPID